ncbi:nucleotidyltransferase domain-containing protein [Roseivivax sediminis]|uniref:Nucleotidyltransferase domain-containing protein n=1 Tax=Roseivivax sediminis TaxID=936889 RepID=A0A1I1ZC73_9RHOB|nr:nucleotidyltransferase domain-containing protein [Roseivivax sediminis]SFE28928.1 hypothetical protein SAMN04515678_10875 [Roseivivax sediminis]
MASAMANISGLDALFLAGSLGRGTEDAFSDIDVVALAEPDRHEALAARWISALEDRDHVVYRRQAKSGQGLLVNAITGNWVRVDLHVLPRALFARRAKDTVTPLIDPEDIHGALPDSLPPARPDPERVKGIVTEFIRMMGLMPVALGRDERVTLVTSVELLRGLLRDLYIEQSAAPDKGGMLHLSKLITPAQMAVLESMPHPGPDRTALIDAHLRIADAFLPEARRLAARLEIDWPDEFEAATAAHIHRETGVEILAHAAA